MKKEEIPQDPSALDNVTRDVCYVVDENGQYTTGLSRGWSVKATALELAWNDINDRIRIAREKVESGEASPILYFMESKLMDPDIVAAYTGFWKWQIRRHMKRNVFNGLSDKKLNRYAGLFEISLERLKNPFADEPAV